MRTVETKKGREHRPDGVDWAAARGVRVVWLLVGSRLDQS